MVEDEKNMIIVRYGEIFLKSEFVRKKFVEKLVSDIESKLKRSRIKNKIYKQRHRIFIKLYSKDDLGLGLDVLKRTFGIKSVSPAIETSSDLQSLKEKTIELADKILSENDTFAIRVTRENYESYTSKELEEILGREVLKNVKCKGVNLTKPKKTIFVEIRGNKAYIFTEKIRCYGGLPYGSQGKVLCLLSGGIDSAVATFLAMKRGCEPIVLTFAKNENDAKIVKKIVEKLQEYSPSEILAYKAEISKALKEIKEKAGKYTCIICKRLMLRVAAKLCEDLKIKAIVTGDNLGQVASQTLENLSSIDAVTEKLVLRPLIFYDKEEIISIARDIGSYELGAARSCEFVPRKPATAARIEKIIEIENSICIEKIAEEMKIERLK